MGQGDSDWETTTDIFPEIKKNDVHLVDLSVSSTWIGHQTNLDDMDLIQFKLGQL